MSKKLLVRIGLLVIVLFGVTILTFFYTNLSPVDAAEALAVRRYNRPTPQQVELVREELGLDQPILQQYGSWLWNALHGDFGNSYNTGRPIVEELSASIRPTLVMAAMALLFATLLSIPLGVLSASRKGGLADRSIYLFGIICMSLPNYWIGFMLLLAFAVYIPVFGIMGADSLKDFILPALALAIVCSFHFKWYWLHCFPPSKTGGLQKATHRSLCCKTDSRVQDRGEQSRRHCCLCAFPALL